MAQPKSRGACRYVAAIVLLLIGLALVFLSVFLFPVVLERVVKKKLEETDVVLRPGSKGFDEWKTPGSTVYYKVYFFNVTNPDHVITGSKPLLSVVGPYVYRDVRVKTNITFSDNQTVLQYKLHSFYMFDREKTDESLDPDQDNITTLNIPFLAVVDRAMNREKQEFEIEVLKQIVKQTREQLFITKAPTKLLWGYQDKLIEILHLLHYLPKATFGLVYNDSEADWKNYSSIRTGSDDINAVGRYVEWRGMTHLPYWGGPQANMINGTDGTLFHPHVKRNESLQLFIDNLYRSSYLDYQKDVKLTWSWMPLYRFEMPKWELWNETRCPLNAQFYANWLYGILNLSNATGAPIYTSFPYFLDADPEIRRNISGLREGDPESDSSFLDIEPITGLVMRFQKQVQVNARVQQYNTTGGDYPNWSQTSYIHDALIPVFYVNETATADYSHVNLVANGIPWGATALGGIIVIICVVLLLVWTCGRPHGYKELAQVSQKK
ncbi:lysosome membrane protein 2-like isoform X1 [Corticium candelabrum]|uniref:lysosome membrane protein 2-like isoform X1 n=1 Tax=Corticium candelabrum TaxID=121492 RepID=UPI002E2747C2|nr:lysosome membrane protein 2-like isoform X1 [Corticium candelabrum]